MKFTMVVKDMEGKVIHICVGVSSLDMLDTIHRLANDRFPATLNFNICGDEEVQNG